MIAVGPDRIDVRSAEDGQLLQSDAIRDGVGIVGTESGLVVYGKHDLYDIHVISTAEQVQSLIDRHSYDDAVDLINRVDSDEAVRVGLPARA